MPFLIKLFTILKKRFLPNLNPTSYLKRYVRVNRRIRYFKTYSSPSCSSTLWSKNIINESRRSSHRRGSVTKGVLRNFLQNSQ